MAERTSYKPGHFNWADLSTSDVDGAKRFYGQVLGWEFQDLPAEGVNYSFALVDGKQVGALYQGDGSTPPHWNNYIAVEDADEAAARAAELGASNIMDPFDVMDVGRMAFVRDPQGAAIALWQAYKHHGASLITAPGALTWHELLTTDVEGAQRFYGELLGWTFQDLGEAMGHYVIANQGKRGVAGFMALPEDGPPSPSWFAVFGADDVDAVAGRAADAGGRLIREPTDIGENAHMGRFAVIEDPQGAVFEVWTGDFSAS